MRRSLRSWLWSVPLEKEVDEEIAFHIEMRTRELIDGGVDPRIAREMAAARLGNVARLRRSCVALGKRRDREMRVTQWLDECGHDIRFAARQMRRAPLFTAVITLTLAFGIGANSAIFALVDATLLRPLPYPNPDRLVKVNERLPNGFQIGPSPLDFEDWREQSRTFAALSAVLQGGRAFTNAEGLAEQVATQVVSAAFFDVVGARPLLGRTFLPGEETPAGDVAVISEAFWRTRFMADPSIIGRQLTLDNQPVTVVGVVPDSAQLLLPGVDNVVVGDRTSVWIPLAPIARSNPVMRQAHYLQVVGRLKPGVTLEMARAEMNAVGERIAKADPPSHGRRGVSVQPLRDVLLGRELRSTSLLLLGVVGFVLLLCCANVANLLLARTMSRARELATRSALGAGRRRIVAQLVTESLLLAALGGVAGAFIGAALLQVAPVMTPPGLLPQAASLTFDARVFAFCAAITVTVGALFGLGPAWRGTGLFIGNLMAGGRSVVGRRGGARTLLVAGEIAVAVLLLTGAGLLLRTFINLSRVDPGYTAPDVLTMIVTLPQGTVGRPSPYSSPDSMRRFYESVEREVAAIPAVKSVAWGNALPLDGTWFGQGIRIDGDDTPPNAFRGTATYQMVTPSYLKTLGIPLLRGRDLSEQDVEGGAPVCLVDEAFVRSYLGDRTAIGSRVIVSLMSMRPLASPSREIVGIVKQVRMRPGETEPSPTIYVPLAQNTWWAASLVVQARDGSSSALTGAVRAAVARVDKSVPLTRVRTMDQVGGDARARWRFRAVLVSMFAGLALLLAMVGVFGALAYAVQQRTREFGVRMALGASVADVINLVARSAAWVTALGVVSGLMAAAFFTRWMATLLFGVTPLDPATFAAVAGVLAVTAALAAAAPALRAARVDPLVTFRAE